MHVTKLVPFMNIGFSTFLTFYKLSSEQNITSHLYNISYILKYILIYRKHFQFHVAFTTSLQESDCTSQSFNSKTLNTWRGDPDLDRDLGLHN